MTWEDWYFDDEIERKRLDRAREDVCEVRCYEERSRTLQL